MNKSIQIKEEILTNVAKHTSDMSDVQFRKHWSEWFMQGLDHLEKAVREENIRTYNVAICRKCMTLYKTKHDNCYLENNPNKESEK